jgi:putative glutamine amidotransferase
VSARQPVIGITCEVLVPERGPAAYNLLCDHRYAESVKRAGGFPLILPIAERPAVIRRGLDPIDGLVFVGGEDVDPALYGERPKPGTGTMFGPRLRFEQALYRGARRRHLPILGVCYGMQLINVLHGGTLYQDIARDAKSPQDHRDKRKPLHAVRIEPGSRLARIVGAGPVRVHCEHHQAVRRLAQGFRAVAHAKDGLVEAMESDAEQVLAVQWHPERTLGSRATQRLFRHLVRLSRRHARGSTAVTARPPSRAQAAARTRARAGTRAAKR